MHKNAATYKIPRKLFLQCRYSNFDKGKDMKFFPDLGKLSTQIILPARFLPFIYRFYVQNDPKGLGHGINQNVSVVLDVKF